MKYYDEDLLPKHVIDALGRREASVRGRMSIGRARTMPPLRVRFSRDRSENPH